MVLRREVIERKEMKDLNKNNFCTRKETHDD